MAAHQAPIPGILQARILKWVAISFSSAWKWKVKVKSLSPVRLFATPWTAAHQAPPSMGFSRQEYWSGLPLPSLVQVELVPFQNLRMMLQREVCGSNTEAPRWHRDRERQNLMVTWEGGQTPPATNTELTDNFTRDNEGGGGPRPFIKVSQVHPSDGKSMGTTAKLPLNQKYRHILSSGEFQDLAQRIVIPSQAWKSWFLT